MTDDQIKQLENMEVRIRRIIICCLLFVAVFLISITVQDYVDNHDKVIDGRYTITYIRDGVKCQYKTNRIKFHDNDNIISFHDAISGNEIMLNHYVIEVEEDG